MARKKLREKQTKEKSNCMASSSVHSLTPELAMARSSVHRWTPGLAMATSKVNRGAQSERKASDMSEASEYVVVW